MKKIILLAVVLLGSSLLMAVEQAKINFIAIKKGSYPLLKHKLLGSGTTVPNVIEFWKVGSKLPEKFQLSPGQTATFKVTPGSYKAREAKHYSEVVSKIPYNIGELKAGESKDVFVGTKGAGIFGAKTKLIFTSGPDIVQEN